MFFYSSGQTFETSLELGYGKYLESDKVSFSNTFSEPTGSTYSAGLYGYIIPRNSKLSIKTGIIYLQRNGEIEHTDFLKIPLGIDIKMGRRLFGIIGAGVHVGFLVGYKYPNTFTDFEDTKNSTIFSGQVNLGIGYWIFERWMIQATYNHIIDFNETYTASYQNSSGVYTEKVYAQDATFNLGLRFVIKKDRYDENYKRKWKKEIDDVEGF